MRIVLASYVQLDDYVAHTCQAADCISLLETSKTMNLEAKEAAAQDLESIRIFAEELEQRWADLNEQPIALEHKLQADLQAKDAGLEDTTLQVGKLQYQLREKKALVETLNQESKDLAKEMAATHKKLEWDFSENVRAAEKGQASLQIEMERKLADKDRQLIERLLYIFDVFSLL